MISPMHQMNLAGKHSRAENCTDIEMVHCLTKFPREAVLTLQRVTLRFTAIFALFLSGGCASYSATTIVQNINDPDAGVSDAGLEAGGRSSHTGGAKSAGGGMATIGGSSTTAGRSQGGFAGAISTVSSGGTMAQTSNGGETAAGGTLSASSGGTFSIGGVPILGGAATNGGFNSTGGSPTNGGRSSSSDATPSGGTLATGGKTTNGSVSAGGGTGASGGLATTGGVSATGGVLALGGVSSVGGYSSIGGSSLGGTTGDGGTTSVQCPFIVAGVPAATTCNVAPGTPCTLSGTLTEKSTGVKIGTYLYNCTCTTGSLGNTWKCMSGTSLECPLATLDNAGTACDSATDSSCSIVFTVDKGLTTKTDCACTVGASNSTWACTAGNAKASCPAAVGIDPTGVPCTSGADTTCSRIYNYGPTSTTYNCACTSGTSGSTWTCTT